MRKRLMPEPGELREPQRLRSAVYMLKLLKDVKKYPFVLAVRLRHADTNTIKEVHGCGSFQDGC